MKDKLKLIMSMILLIPFVVLLVSGIIQSEYVSPIDGYYLIDRGSITGNITFSVNATPTGESSNIVNITLWSNMSGTWTANYSNSTDGTVGTETNRLFIPEDTSIYTYDLGDGLVFVYNFLACENKTIFENEAVVLTGYTGTLSNYPVATIDKMDNGSDSILGECNLTTSTGGLICNSTVGSSLLSVNYTISDPCQWVSSNRTMYVEEAPAVVLNTPTDSSVSATTTVEFNYTVTGDSDTYTCQLYSNDTGTWHEEAANSNVANNTLKTTSTVITQGNGIVWNVRCSETSNSNIRGWAPANFTITTDSTNPTLTTSAESYSNSVIATDGYSAFINITATDTNANDCLLYINDSLNNTVSYTSGVPFAQFFNASDGTYNWLVTCDNDAGGSTSSANTSIVIDTVAPTLSSVINGSDITSCIAMPLNFTLSEVSNFTLEYGLTDNSRTSAEREADYSLVHEIDLTFNDKYETGYYANYTFCDPASNCNTAEYDLITTPITLCTGWSIWSVYASITLSAYRTASGADYVYYWNNTAQAWGYSSAAGDSSANTVGVGDVVYLYESTNTTYFRNNEGTSGFHINITGGHVYIPMYYEWSFGNLSTELFKNTNKSATSGNVTEDSTYGKGGLQFQIDYFAGYNNSAQNYQNKIYTWNWNNDTLLGKSLKNGIDTLWFYSDYNISLNVTPGGQVYGNWT